MAHRRHLGALELAKEWGADQTVKVEEGYVDTVLEMTDGKGAEVVFDYVAGDRGLELAARFVLFGLTLSL